MASVDSIVAQLRQAVDHLHQAATSARAAWDMAEEMRDRADSLGTYGLTRQLAGIVDKAEQLLAMLVAGIDAGERLIAQAEAIRGGGAAGGTGGGAVSAGGAGTPASRPVPAEKVPVTPGWRQRFLGEVPEHVRQAGTRLRPRVPGDDRSTVGILDGEEIRSGREGKSAAADLDHAPLSGLPVVFERHVESKVAARMREEARRRPEVAPHAEVVIDNTTCGTNDRDRDYEWTCDKVLPSILPRGSTLVVWSTCDGGRSFWRRAYHGTGERIRG